MRINNYASENVRRKPAWKKVDCPKCPAKKGQNCMFELSSCGFNVFIHEERILAGEKFKRDLEIEKYKE